MSVGDKCWTLDSPFVRQTLRPGSVSKVRFFVWILHVSLSHLQFQCADGKCSPPDGHKKLSLLPSDQHSHHPPGGMPGSCCPGSRSPVMCSGRSIEQGNSPSVRQHTSQYEWVHSLCHHSWWFLLQHIMNWKTLMYSWSACNINRAGVSSYFQSTLTDNSTWSKAVTEPPTYVICNEKRLLKTADSSVWLGEAVMWHSPAHKCPQFTMVGKSRLHIWGIWVSLWGN